MLKHAIALTVALVAAQPATPARPVRTMYAAAMAREQAARAMLSADAAPASVLKDIRSAIAAYRAIVRLYPASGYCDDALWQAARLAADAFARFGQSRDKDTAERLLNELASQYPSSKFVARVPEQRAALSPGSTAPAALPLTQVAARTESVHRVAILKDVRRTVLPDAVRVTIEFDAEVAFHDERLSDPPRVFLDLPSTRAAPQLLDRALSFEGDADVVRQVRIGRHPGRITRVVLDAAGVSSYSIYALYGPFRLVIDCSRPQGTAVSASPELPKKPPLLVGRATAAGWGRAMPSVPLSPVAALHDPPAEAPAAAAPPVLAPATPPSMNLAGGFSMSRQLGLGVSRIVIDPGHGGRDPGAQGRGITEAELVLDVAQRLRKLLEKIPGIEVILTRDSDEFVPLQERTAIANREGADLFLSIHANGSTNSQAHGIETYFLNFANNLGAASVAARENAASGQAMGALPDLVKAIALNNKLDESRDFATFVQRAMAERLRRSNRPVKNLGVKQAPFVVLIGAAMPSVLAEISFVTNPQEAKLLRSGPYRQRIAEALLNAIRRYQTALKNVRTVAHQ